MRADPICIVKQGRRCIRRYDYVVEKIRGPYEGTVFNICLRHWTQYAEHMVRHGYVVAEERSTYDDPPRKTRRQRKGPSSKN